MKTLTKKETKVLNNILKDKALVKNIDKTMTYGNITVEEKIINFIDDAKSYIKAIKDARMINSVASVSSSGMSRQIKFLACTKGKQGYNYYNFYNLFISLGYSESKNNSGYFSISGCGMDMIFATNYNNMHTFKRIGLITSKECAILAQKTPTTI